MHISLKPMSGSEERFVADAFKSNFVAPLGPHLDKFEDSVKEYLEDKNLHCVGLSSGTAALHLALRLEGKEGDKCGYRQ